MKQARRKLKSSAGFSLGEMLVTVLILMLASVIMATGMPAAQNAYEKVVIGANAKALLSTTVSALRDELATAQNVTVTGKVIDYYSANNGSTSQLTLDEKAIMLQEYTDYAPAPGSDGSPSLLHTVEPRNLVSAKAATADLYVKCGSAVLSAERDQITLGNIEVCRVSNDHVLASVRSLTIRFIKPAPTPATT